MLTFSIVKQLNEIFPFEIIQTSGEKKATLRRTTDFDREWPESLPLRYRYVKLGNELKYPVAVEVSDNGNPKLSTTCYLLVTILDINDNAPQFLEGLEASMPKKPLRGDKVLQVYAFDPDEGQNGEVSYNITRWSTDCNCFVMGHNGWIIFIGVIEEV